jgi:hypothetical protein
MLLPSVNWEEYLGPEPSAEHLELMEKRADARRKKRYWNELSRIRRITHREENREYARKYREQHGDEVRAKKRGAGYKRRTTKDCMFVLAYNRSRHNAFRNDPEFLKKQASYNKKQKQKPMVRVILNLRRRLVLALHGEMKADGTMKLLGCTPQEFRSHLEKQFSPGMTWNNYGKNGWSMDHIIPCLHFDLSKPEEQKKCFHYTNIRPLLAKDNSRKKDLHQYSSIMGKRQFKKKGSTYD